MAACNQGRFLTVGQLASYLGVAKRSAAKMIDAGFLPGSFRLPGSTDRRVPLQSALTFAKQNGMDESSRELERLAIDRGLQVVTRPALLIVSLEPIADCFACFDVSCTRNLFDAGALFSHRRFDAVLVDGRIGSREAQHIVWNIRSLPNLRTMSAALVPEDGNCDVWIDHGYHLAWKLPASMAEVSAELMRLCTAPAKSKRKQTKS